MKSSKFILIFTCFIVGLSIPFYGFSSPRLYLLIAVAFSTIITWYKRTKNKGKWDARKNQELLTWGLMMMIAGGTLCMIALKSIQSQQGEMYETEDGTITNVDPEFENKKAEEYDLFKENAILLGRWEPAEEFEDWVKYMYGRSDVLIYQKNESYFMVYENGYAKNFIERGLGRGMVIFGTYHFFYPDSLTFEDDTYIRIE